jgi:hypothetical protein
MAGLFDKAKEFLGDEERSDSLLDKAAQAADKATGGKHSEQIRQARKAADDRLGDEQGGKPRTTDPTANRDRL